ncbi:MAG: TIM barrel protein [Niameybacter sp.]|uniref:hypothetical protein n=1 Tax=Niameybacter sp. TaxID=2033640 RepID=UPI002FCA6478
MERLFHISTTPKYINFFQDDWSKIEAFSQKHQMDGIELGLTIDYDISQIPEGIVQGVHLSFYPMWLDFWRGDLAKVESILGSHQALLDYYGGTSKEVMIESYKQQYARAKALKAKYMVLHVSHICIEDSFTWQFDYTDEEVIDATIELVNEVFPADEDGPMLLFENLWWPGLTYLDQAVTKKLLEGVQYTKKGLLMDISHLTLTNLKIGNEKECYTYIKEVVENLGELKSFIYGVHLNKTLPKHYMQQDRSYLVDRYREAKTPQLKMRVLKQHIQKLDPHQPFDHEIAKQIVECIDPQFCVYETNPEDIYEMAYFMKKQNIALGISYK